MSVTQYFQQTPRLTSGLPLLQDRVSGLESMSDPGLEALNLGIRIADFFTRIVNSFRANVLNRWSDFRRSELRAYNEGNMRSVKLFFSKPHLDLESYQVPIPDGMKVPYIQAASGLLDLMVELQISQTLDELLGYFGSVSEAADPASLVDLTTHLAQKINQVSRDGVERKLRGLFIDRVDSKNVPASHVFSSLHEIMQVNGKVLTFEKYFLEAAQNVKRCQAIEEKTKNLVTSQQEMDPAEINPGFIRALQALVSTAAVQLDMYGAILHEMQRVEHVFTITLESLVDEERRRS